MKFNKTQQLTVVELQSKKRAELALSTELVAAEQRIRSTFSFLDASVVFWHVSPVTEVFRRLTLVYTHEKKRTALRIDSGADLLNPDKVIYNFSSVTIPTRVKFLLAFGLDFCLPAYRIDVYKYFLPFEKFSLSLKINKLPIIPEFNNQLQSLSYKFFYIFFLLIKYFRQLVLVMTLKFYVIFDVTRDFCCF